MSRLLYAIPVLGRPARAAPAAASAKAAVPDARILFLCSRGDAAEQRAAKATGADVRIVPWRAGPGDWARKLNLAIREEAEEWMLLGADDLTFHPGWFEACLRAHARTGACVVGTNDLGNQRTIRGYHSTHPLVHRDYLECGTIDEDEKILHEGYTHQYCNPPEAPVWMADLSFRPIGSVRVGDRVIGWEYSGDERPAVGPPRRSLCYSDVLAVGRRSAELVRVVMESGREFRCTPDHRWLNGAWMPSSSHYRQWVEPRQGRSLLHVIDEPRERFGGFEREYGWLAGIYDGEGSGIVVASQSSGHPEVVAEIERLLTALEIPHTHSLNREMHAFVLTGGRQGYLDFLLQVQPTRRDSLASYVVGYRRREGSRLERAEIGARRFGHRDRIVAVEPLAGTEEVVSMTTSSGNYVAHGYASRNCDDEFVQTAHGRGTYVHAFDAHVEHLHPNWGKGERDATYARGEAGFWTDKALYEARCAMWLAGRARRRGRF